MVWTKLHPHDNIDVVHTSYCRTCPCLLCFESTYRRPKRERETTTTPDAVRLVYSLLATGRPLFLLTIYTSFGGSIVLVLITAERKLDMATHDLHFTVSQNGVEDPSSLHDSPTMPEIPSTNNGGTTWGQTLSKSSHPMVCIFHMLFKGLALFFYIFGGIFARDGKGHTSGANFITVTVVCILLLAADFWVVKNITGRLLVGLRWWNKVEGDTTTWIFESAGDNRPINKFDSSVFWTVLYATPLVWSSLLVIGILKFNLGWLIIVVMALALSFANVYGYYKCSNDQKAKFQQMMAQGAQAGAMTMIKSNMLGWLTGTSSTQSTGPTQSTYV